MKEKICAIYKIENLNNGKVYIGSSTDFYARLSTHKTHLKHNCHTRRDMQDDYNKGDRFDFSILQELPNHTTKENLLKLEREYIIKYDSAKTGYNFQTPGGRYFEITYECNDTDFTFGKIKYKINIMKALKSKGYSSFRLRKENLFSQATMTKFRNGIICYGNNGSNLDKLCRLLDCQPGDIIEYVPDGPAED